MKVVNKVIITNNPKELQSIEFVTVATWEEGTPLENEKRGVFVLRNKYEVDGVTDEARTAEITIEDLSLLMIVAADFNLLEDANIEAIQAALTKNLMRNQIAVMLEDGDEEAPNSDGSILH